MEGHGSRAPVCRQEWITMVVQRLQNGMGRAVVCSVDEAEKIFERIAASVPAAHTVAERLILRALLTEFAYRAGAQIHALMFHSKPRCGFHHADLLKHFFADRSERPQDTLVRWSRRLVAELRRTHPPTPSRKVATVIRTHYRQPLNISALAHRVHLSPSGLRRAFAREFGMSLRTYHTNVRLLASLKDVTKGKVEAIALQVGYQSKKNYYRAFRRIIGMTPTRFRQLSKERAGELIDSARFELLCRRHTRRRA
jgi:methylphosphotriester-DNA--protein-cysteine methyltransferase